MMPHNNHLSPIVPDDDFADVFQSNAPNKAIGPSGSDPEIARTNPTLPGRQPTRESCNGKCANEPNPGFAHNVTALRRLMDIWAVRTA